MLRKGVARLTLETAASPKYATRFVRDLVEAVTANHPRDNIRIAIGSLTIVAKTLGDCRVVAAGNLFATIECDKEQRAALSKAGISWNPD